MADVLLPWVPLSWSSSVASLSEQLTPLRKASLACRYAGLELEWPNFLLSQGKQHSTRDGQRSLTLTVQNYRSGTYPSQRVQCGNHDGGCDSPGAICALLSASGHTSNLEVGILDHNVSAVTVSHHQLTIWASIYQGIALVGVTLLYFPSKHSRLVGLARRQVIREIDYMGGLLSLAGLTLL